jgi:YfiR/HmsC-like
VQRYSLVFYLCFILTVSNSLGALDREYQIKAEFLERFTRFIQWPGNSSVSNTSAPFHLCVIGENPYGTYLQDLAAATKIQKKQLIIKEISSPEQAEICNLLFISGSEKDSLAQILSRTGHKPILTVADSPGFAQSGVLINFYEDAGFVHFEINQGAVQKSGLKFSSRLYKLGRLVSHGISGGNN